MKIYIPRHSLLWLLGSVQRPRDSPWTSSLVHGWRTWRSVEATRGPKRCRRRLRFLRESAEKGRKSHSRPSSTKLERLSFKEGHVVNRRLRLTEQSSEVFTVTLRNLSLWQLQTRMSPSGRRITIVFALREKKLFSSLTVLFWKRWIFLHYYTMWTHPPLSRIRWKDKVSFNPQSYFSTFLCASWGSQVWRMPVYPVSHSLPVHHRPSEQLSRFYFHFCCKAKREQNP